MPTTLADPDALNVFDVTLTLDTAIYAAGDVLSDTAVITDAVRVGGGRARLVSLALIDEDDQGVAIDLVFFSANRSLGTKNAAVTISDADLRDALGHVSIVTGDYTDLINSRLATKSGLDLVLEAAAASQNLYVASVVRGGTPTFTANGLRLRLGLVTGL